MTTSTVYTGRSAVLTVSLLLVLSTAVAPAIVSASEVNRDIGEPDSPTRVLPSGAVDTSSINDSVVVTVQHADGSAATDAMVVADGPEDDYPGEGELFFVDETGTAVLPPGASNMTIDLTAFTATDANATETATVTLGDSGAASVTMTLPLQNTTSTNGSQDEPSTDSPVLLDVNRTVGATSDVPGDPETVTLNVTTARAADRLLVTERFIPGFERGTIDTVTVSGGNGEVLLQSAVSDGIDVALTNVTANTTITVRYTVHPAANVTAGSNFSIYGHVEMAATTTTAKRTTLDRYSVPCPALTPGVDGNDNGAFEDEELRTAIDHWKADEPVPDTCGKTLEDTELLGVIETWRQQRTSRRQLLSSLTR